MTDEELNRFIVEKVLDLEYLQDRSLGSLVIRDQSTRRTEPFSPSTNLNHCAEAEAVLKKDPEKWREYGRALMDAVTYGYYIANGLHAARLATLDARTRCGAMVLVMGDKL